MKIIFTCKQALVIVVAMFPLWLFGQVTFKPVLSEGKSWEVARLSHNPVDGKATMDTINTYTLSVCGDTIINNLTCKKVLIVSEDSQESSKTAVAYEENGKVWNVREDGEMELLFDIGLHPYESFFDGYVLAEDFVRVNGVSRKRLNISVDYDDVDYDYYVVEGVGVNNNFLLRGHTGNIGPCVMLSCSENGEIIFTKDDFTKDDYVPLVREGVVWEYVGYESSLGLELGEEVELYTLEFNGATELTDNFGNTNVYHNLYRTNYDEQGNAQEPYLAAYAKEEYRQVEAIGVNYWPGFEVPDRVYNFYAPMFIMPPSYPEYPYPYNLNNSTMIDLEVAGTFRKAYHIACDGNSETANPFIEEFKTIEGIGVDCAFGDLLMPYRPFSADANASDGEKMSGLSAVYENGELVYKGCMYDVAQRLKHKKEDVDGDGHVTSADVTAIYNFLLNSTDEYDYNVMYDVDGDCKVTAADITAVYNKILGQ